MRPAVSPVELLAAGRVRVLGVWPRAVDAEVVDDGRVLRCAFRRGRWLCMCGDEAPCSHVLAVQLVARPSLVTSDAAPVVDARVDAGSVERERSVASSREVRQVFTTGADVWACAIELWRAVADADGLGAASDAVRRVMAGLTDEDVRDLVVALAVVPRFGIRSQAMQSTEVLDLVVCRMAWSWDS